MQYRMNAFIRGNTHACPISYRPLFGEMSMLARGTAYSGDGGYDDGGY